MQVDKKQKGKNKKKVSEMIDNGNKEMDLKITII